MLPGSTLGRSVGDRKRRRCRGSEADEKRRIGFSGMPIAYTSERYLAAPAGEVVTFDDEGAGSSVADAYRR